jgi:DNA-binding NarL/FixJ family response regulator
MSNGEIKVLFADDEPWLTEGLRAVLEADGIVCISVNNATQAIRALETKEINLLVTDIMMPAGEAFPGVDSSVAGFALIERVRRGHGSVGIVCLSVIRDGRRIKELKRQNVLFFSKGEISLETAKRLIYSKITGRYTRRSE